MAQRTRRIGKQLGAPAQQLLSEIFDLQRVHELFFVARTIVWRQLRAHSSPQTPVQNGGGVYESRSLDSTINAAIHRVDSAQIPPKRHQRAPVLARPPVPSAARNRGCGGIATFRTSPARSAPLAGIVQSNRGAADLELFK